MNDAASAINTSKSEIESFLNTSLGLSDEIAHFTNYTENSTSVVKAASTVVKTAGSELRRQVQNDLVQMINAAKADAESEVQTAVSSIESMAAQVNAMMDQLSVSSTL
jgi:F0F1-type ATP synthase membrane subunit b/b'